MCRWNWNSYGQASDYHVALILEEQQFTSYTNDLSPGPIFMNAKGMAEPNGKTQKSEAKAIKGYQFDKVHKPFTHEHR